MSVTSVNRNINDLLPAAQQACKLLFQECFKSGITDIFITETYRSQARQDYLYAQGRTRPGTKVTWTRTSNHTGRLAFDIAIASPKYLYDISTLNKVGAIAQKLGITWGGTWQNIDRPHFEVKSSWQIPKGYALEGQVMIPTDSKTRVNLILPNPTPVPSVVYEAHIQEIGWQGSKRNGETAGTTGRGLRLEALTVKLANTNAKLEMQAHIEEKGWTPVRTNGEIVGTMGEALRLEAIAMNCDQLAISYRVHVQDIGWTQWKKNGEIAGTVGQEKRIEAVEIKLA